MVLPQHAEISNSSGKFLWIQIILAKSCYDGLNIYISEINSIIVKV